MTPDVAVILIVGFVLLLIFFIFFPPVVPNRTPLALLLVLLAALAFWAAPAESHPLEVAPADHWAYAALYRLAAKGLAPLWAMSARPLTRLELARMVARSLDQLAADRSRFTQADLADLEALAREFAGELALLGYRALNPSRDSPAPVLAGRSARLDRAFVAPIEAGAPPRSSAERAARCSSRPKGCWDLDLASPRGLR